MSDTRAKELIKQGDKLWSRRGQLEMLWQAIAEQFKPDRADFTTALNDVALVEHLFTSYPVLACRELSNIFAAMLRPRTAKWFSIHASDKDMDEGTAEREYLEWRTDVMWRAMYDPEAGFVRATKEADGDYVTFGQAVIQPELDLANATLLYRCHHIRDTVWSENYAGRIDHVQRKWKPTARQLAQMFPKTISPEVQQALTKDPETEFECRHIVVPERVYRPDSVKNQTRFPYTSLYVECGTETVLEETPRKRFGYVIPRWMTVSGSQYARSPATEPSLPDARTMQVVVRTLREAGEKHVDPPRVTPAEPLRSDIMLMAGGVTYYDSDYDEKSGEILRPVDSNPGTMPIGHEMAIMLQEAIRNGMFLDKVNLPQQDLSKMPVYTVRRVLEEQIRAQAPLFEPIEQEYSAPLCEETHALLSEVGAFGPADNIPESLRGTDIDFTFQSPLRDIADSMDTQMYMDGLGILGNTLAMDPAQIADINLTEGKRAALKGLGWKQDWFHDKKAVEQAQRQQAERARMEAGAEAIGAGAEALGKAAPALKQIEAA